MSEDHTSTTVITPILKRAASKWRTWGPPAAGALIAAFGVAIAYGHKQADGEMQVQDFKRLQAEVQQMHGELIQVKESQARTEGTLGAISLWAQGVAKFQTSVQKGAEEALATPVPKSHRK